MENIKKEFYNMSMATIFEIEDVNGEYHIYYIDIIDNKFYLGGMTNNGFIGYDDLFIEIDNYFSLDEHLAALYEIACQDTSNKTNNTDKI